MAVEKNIIDNSLEIIRGREDLARNLKYHEAVIEALEKAILVLTHIVDHGTEKVVRKFGPFRWIQEKRVGEMAIAEARLKKIDYELSKWAKLQYQASYIERSVQWEVVYDRSLRECRENWDSLVKHCEPIAAKNADFKKKLDAIVTAVMQDAGKYQTMIEGYLVLKRDSGYKPANNG